MQKQELSEAREPLGKELTDTHILNNLEGENEEMMLNYMELNEKPQRQSIAKLINIKGTEL